MGFAMRAQSVTQGGTPATVGIDLGTCYSRVAVWQDGDVLLIPNERGRLATPSCVAFTDTQVLVGEAAQEQADDNPANTHWGPQRLVGDKFTNPWVQWYMRQWPDNVVRSDDDKPLIKVRDRGKDRLVRPEEIVTLLLAHLRRNAEKFLSVTVMDAVVTIPARCGRYQQEAILAACRGARLNVLELVKSPTSSAIAYSLTNRRDTRRNVLVCNMGGSYFDFALLRIDDCHLRERGVGTEFVDLDGSLVRFCTRELWEKSNINLAASHPVALQRLRRACEMAKRKLSQFHQARIEIRGIVEDMDYYCNISRPHFEDLCKDDIGTLLDSIACCLEDGGLEKADVHDIVLVGGSARVPMLRRAIREFFYGKVPREVLRPDHAAVLGAAAYAAKLAATRGSSAEQSAAGAKAPPDELKQLKLTQVSNWTQLPTEETADDEKHGNLTISRETSRLTTGPDAEDNDGDVDTSLRPAGESNKPKQMMTAPAKFGVPGANAPAGPTGPRCFSATLQRPTFGPIGKGDTSGSDDEATGPSVGKPVLSRDSPPAVTSSDVKASSSSTPGKKEVPKQDQGPWSAPEDAGEEVAECPHTPQSEALTPPCRPLDLRGGGVSSTGAYPGTGGIASGGAVFGAAFQVTPVKPTTTAMGPAASQSPSPWPPWRQDDGETCSEGSRSKTPATSPA